MNKLQQAPAPRFPALGREKDLLDKRRRREGAISHSGVLLRTLANCSVRGGRARHSVKRIRVGALGIISRHILALAPRTLIKAR